MSLKDLIKEKLTKKADMAYELRVNEADASFDSWIRVVENGLERFDMTVDPDMLAQRKATSSYVTHYDGMTVRIFPYAKVGGNFVIKNIIEDIIVFANGELTDRAIPLIVKCFKTNPECSIVYGDEDIAVLDEDESGKYGRTVYGTRNTPFFKPDWSPNAFLSHFYFCNICAIRRVSFREVEWSYGREGADGIYHTLLRYIYEDRGRVYKSVQHIDEILLHATDYANNEITDSNAKNLALRMKVENWNGGPSMERPTKIAVVIPSKDNSRLLGKCITSLYDACPGTISLDLCVVDNGSSTVEKDCVEALREKYGFKYEYHPMEFNFARMCNIGVEKTEGDYILFLNDDVSFTDPYTLEEMLDQASYSFTGAVGAKLLYPGSGKIQHAGVINNRIGPVHKLQFADDTKVYYHGFNKYIQNVLAVTGACLMVRRGIYDNLGGMSEGLKIAFNDVDLCFGLFETGYYNVCCNNISLEHAESVSRGKDTDKDSLIRLLNEKRTLYEEHPAFKGTDPFYSKYLISDCLDTRIVPAGEYEYKRCMEEAVSLSSMSLSKAREDACVFLNIEYADLMSGFSFDEEDEGYYIQGFAFVTGSDNACYKRFLILQGKDMAYAIPYEGCLRKDVAENCKDQTNVELSGFSIRIPKEHIPAGTYRVGVLLSHRFAKEKLYSFSNRELVVK